MIHYILFIRSFPWYYLAIDDLKAFVKLLTSTLPSVMAPKPEFWLLTDAGFKHLMIDVCRLIFLQLLGCTSYQLELSLVIASFLLCHLEKEDCLMVLDSDALRTCHDGRIMVQEPTPVMDIVPMRHLIA